MSYTNPKIYAADPLAFSQAFMQGFKNTFDAFQKVAENIKKQKERDDLIQADLIKFKNIGDLEGVNASVNNGIQQSINSVIDAGTFAKKSAVERQKDLNDVAKLKAGSEAFVQLYAIDLDELSNKSKLANPELDAVLSQLKADPNKVQITGDKNTIDVKFTTTTEGGITHTVSLRDMNKYLSTYKSIAEDEADWENNIGADSKMIQALIEDDARKGIPGDLRATRIAEHLNKKGTLDADTSSYLFYEKISDDKKGGVSEWHPTEDPLGNKLNEELRKEIWAAQDKLVQDVYTEELEERIYTINVKPQPAVGAETDPQFTKDFSQEVVSFQGVNSAAVNFMSTATPEQIVRRLSQDPKTKDKYITGEQLFDMFKDTEDFDKTAYDKNAVYRLDIDKQGNAEPIRMNLDTKEEKYDFYMKQEGASDEIRNFFKQRVDFGTSNEIIIPTDISKSMKQKAAQEVFKTMDFLKRGEQGIELEFYDEDLPNL